MSQDIGTGRTRSRGFGLYRFLGEAPRERFGASMAAGQANDQVTGTWDGRPEVLLGTGCGPRPPQRAPMDSPRPGAALGPAVHSAITGHAADRDEDDATSIDPECVRELGPRGSAAETLLSQELPGDSPGSSVSGRRCASTMVAAVSWTVLPSCDAATSR